VEVSPDLRIAKVYFSVIGGKKDIQKQINIVLSMQKSVRARLAEKIELKYTPKVQLIYDDTPKKAQELEKLFRKIAKKEK
jgi:ribosome-binding factor A